MTSPPGNPELLAPQGPRQCLCILMVPEDDLRDHTAQQLKVRLTSRPRLDNSRASPVAQTVKNPLVMWETWVQSLGWDDPLEEGIATHSSILAWRILMNRGAWQATVHGVAESDMTWRLIADQHKQL